MTPEQVIAREAIIHTQSVYNTEGDRGRVEGLVQTFTVDGVLELDRGVFSGREEISRALSAAVEDKRQEAATAGQGGSVARIFLRHNLTTRRIEFLGADEADVWTYFFVITPIGLDHSGVYVDRFVQRDDRWLIARRRVKIDWQSEHSTILPPR